MGQEEKARGAKFSARRDSRTFFCGVNEQTTLGHHLGMTTVVKKTVANWHTMLGALEHGSIRPLKKDKVIISWYT